jgi:hypothetical protein
MQRRKRTHCNVNGASDEYRNPESYVNGNTTPNPNLDICPSNGNGDQDASYGHCSALRDAEAGYEYSNTYIDSYSAYGHYSASYGHRSSHRYENRFGAPLRTTTDLS